MARLTDEQIATIAAVAEGNGFGRHVTTINLEDFHAILADLEEARRMRDEVVERAERVNSRAINLISRLCPDHIAEAKEMSFGVFMDRTEKNGCEWCAVTRGQTAERERDEARERNDNLSEELRTVLIELAEVREFAKRLSEELNGEDNS